MLLICMVCGDRDKNCGWTCPIIIEEERKAYAEACARNAENIEVK